MNTTLHIFPSTSGSDAHNRSLLKSSEVVLGQPALTVRRLAEELAQTATIGQRLLSPVGRRLLLHDLINRRCLIDTGCFATLHRFPGFIGAIGSVLAEMKQALISPKELSLLSKQLLKPSRCEEIASLYADYQEMLAKKGLLDHQDIEATAITNVTSGLPLTLLRNTRKIHFHHIYDYTPSQVALIAALAIRLPVIVEFPYDFERTTLFSYVSRTVESFEALDDIGLQLELRFSEQQRGVLEPVLVKLFSEPTQPFPLQGNVSIFAAPGPYRECEEIGRRIRQLIEAGADPSEIAVVVRNTEGYSDMMEEICRRFRIPISFRRGAPLFTAPLIRAALTPLELVEGGLQRDQILSLLKSSYFPHLSDTRGSVHPDEFETLLIRAQYVDTTLEPLKKRVSRWIESRKKQGIDTTFDQRLLSLLLPLLQDISVFQGKKGILEFTGLIETFIEKYGIYRRGIEVGDQRMLKRDASAITLFQKVLKGLHDDLATLGMENELFTPGEFLDLLRQGMSEEFLSGERGYGVRILNFHDARGLTFDHLFIAGINEGKCPVRHNEDPLFKDEDKAVLNRATRRRCFRTAAEKGLEEPLLFYMALSTATASADLSYSYADASGNAILPSPYLAEFLLHADLPVEKIPASPVTPLPDACLDEEELLNSLAHQRIDEGSAPPSLRKKLALINEKVTIEGIRDCFFRSGEGTGKTSSSGAYTGTIHREDLASAVRKQFSSSPGNVFSATALESFGRCPFRFFLERLVRITEQEPPGLELQPAEEGALIHLILQRFFTRCDKENLLPLQGRGEELTIAREEATEVIQTWEKENFTGNSTLWEIEKQRIYIILEAVVAAEGLEATPLRPSAFEAPFDGVEVPTLEGEPFYLKGKIDRIDADPLSGTLRVVDYKMGSNSQHYAAMLKKDAMGDTSFQVPIYLLAAAGEMESRYGSPFSRFMARYWLLRRVERCDKDFENSKEDFAGFFSIDPQIRRSLGEDNFFNRLCNKIEAIRAGDFRISPRGDCDFCIYLSVCRYIGIGVEEAE